MIPKEVELKRIKLKDLEVAPANIRKDFVDADLDKLQETMKHLDQSDLIYVVPKDGKYLIFKGQRRFLAAKKLMEQGKAIFDLAAAVFPDTYSEKTQIYDSFVEDDAQVSVSPRNKGQAIARLRELGESKDDILKKLGISEENFVWYLSLLGSPGTETIKERDEESKLTPPDKKTSLEEELSPSISKTGTLEKDPFKGLTVVQRSEVMARHKEDPSKSLQEHADDVKDFVSDAREIQGLSLKIEYIDRFNALAKKTKSESMRHEIEKYINSKKTDEYLKEQGV